MTADEEQPYRPGWLLDAMDDLYNRPTLTEQIKRAAKEKPDHPAAVLELLGPAGRIEVSNLFDELSTDLAAMSDAVRANDAADLVASVIACAGSLDALEAHAPDPSTSEPGR